MGLWACTAQTPPCKLKINRKWSQTKNSLTEATAKYFLRDPLLTQAVQDSHKVPLKMSSHQTMWYTTPDVAPDDIHLLALTPLCRLLTLSMD